MNRRRVVVEVCSQLPCRFARRWCLCQSPDASSQQQDIKDDIEGFRSDKGLWRKTAWTANADQRDITRQQARPAADRKTGNQDQRDIITTAAT